VRIDTHRSSADTDEQLRRGVREGLSAERKWLPAKWFYDARGSELFDRITALPEYYPTRAEREILVRESQAIAAATDARTLVELGAGSSEKTRALLDGLRRHGTVREFVPQDVSASALTAAAEAIAADYPGLDVHGVVGDFTENLGVLPGTRPGSWCSSAARSATSCRQSGRSSCARCGTCWRPANGCCWAPTW